MQIDPTEISVNADRLLTDLDALGKIGRAEDRGIYRMAFTEADMEGRHWLMNRLKDHGLEAGMDGAGNVSGRFREYGEEPVVMVGSHLDTVPAGGPLDGALGVVAGLECLRRIKEENLADKLHPVELIAFSDEEGRFGGFFGSRALCGELIPQAIHESVDLDGIRLSDAMQAVGLDPMAALTARRSQETVRNYLELHIEQGPVLDSMHVPIGVVEHITGLFRWQIRFIGHSDHAGTTPMPMRRDAMMALAEFAGEIPRVLEENGSESSVATIGSVLLFPGTANTVPGQADFTLDVRDGDTELLDELGNTMRRALSAIGRRRGLMFEFDYISSVRPVPCDQALIKAVSRAAEGVNSKYHHMMSGAGHDAQIMARMAPIGMVFVPSKDGRSHSVAEWTHHDDIVAGANVLLQTLLDVAGERSS